MKRLALLLAALSPLIAFAGDSCCYDSFCDDQACASIGVEYLYFQPCIHDPYFVVDESVNAADENNPDGRRYANNLPFHSGVRVKAAYNLSCYCVELYGEAFWLGDRESRTVTRAVAVGTEVDHTLGTKGHPSADENSVGIATSRINYDIWSVKGGFRKCFDTCYPFMAAGRFGLNYAQAYFKEFIFMGDLENVEYTAHAQTWGIGPELGIDLGFRILPCLAFVVRGSYGLLVGQARSNTNNDDFLENVGDSAVNDTHCLVFPVPEVKAGFLYDLPFQCVCASLEVGYDIIRYTDMLDTIRWIGDGDGDAGGGQGLSLDYIQAFMLHGLYVSLSASF